MKRQIDAHVLSVLPYLRFIAGGGGGGEVFVYLPRKKMSLCATDGRTDESRKKRANDFVFAQEHRGRERVAAKDKE